METKKQGNRIIWLAGLAAIGVCLFWGAVLLGDGGPRASFPEVEPNDAKATANVIYPLMNGDTITGTSTSSTGTGLDYFRVKTGPLLLGVYKHHW